MKRNRGVAFLSMMTAAVVLLPLAGGSSASTANLPLGPKSGGMLSTYKAYYDGHLDTFVVTDVSNRAQSNAMHINYSAELGSVKGLPAQYFIEGRTASNQLSVFGSEPGEGDYNPLWEEFVVTWRSGVKPVLLTSDTQIAALEKQNKLTSVDAHVVLNAPILSVGKK